MWSFGGVVAQQSALPGDLLAKIEAGQFRAAETEARALLGSDPANARVQFALGYVLYREQRYPDSLAAYTAGARSETPGTNDLIVVASDYIQLRSYGDAVRWLTYVTEHAPGNAQAWYLLGRSLYLQDRPDAALPAFARSLELEPRNTRAKYNQGLVLERLDRPAEAEAAYRQAIAWATEDGSSDPQPWLDLGNLLLAQGRGREAAEALATAAAKGPANPMCQQQYGVALGVTGDTARAVEYLQRAIALAPDAERAHYYLGRSYRALGKQQEAAAEFATVDRLLSGHSSRETPNPESDGAPHKGGEKSKGMD